MQWVQCGPRSPRIKINPSSGLLIRYVGIFWLLAGDCFNKAIHLGGAFIELKDSVTVQQGQVTHIHFLPGGVIHQVTAGPG